MFVKICGLREASDAELSAALGADAVGVVHSPGSPRDASEAQARAVIEAARAVSPAIDTVLVVRGVAVSDAISWAQRLGFDVLQLHGGYTAADFALATTAVSQVWRATSLADEPDLIPGAFGEERLLIDGSSPGSGETWDLRRAQAIDLGSHWLLAGGLTPENVSASIALARPAGVDVSSGVESSRGVKSPERIRAFVAAVRAVE